MEFNYCKKAKTLEKGRRKMLSDLPGEQLCSHESLQIFSACYKQPPTSLKLCTAWRYSLELLALWSKSVTGENVYVRSCGLHLWPSVIWDFHTHCLYKTVNAGWVSVQIKQGKLGRALAKDEKEGFCVVLHCVIGLCGQGSWADSSVWAGLYTPLPYRSESETPVTWEPVHARCSSVLCSWCL